LAKKISSPSPYLNVDVEMRFWKDTSDFLAKNWTSTLTERGRGGGGTVLGNREFAKIKFQDQISGSQKNSIK